MEADKALRDYRKLFSAFKLKFADVAWTPTGQAIAPAAAPASIGPLLPATPTLPAAVAAPAAKPRIGVRSADVTPALAVGLVLDTPRGALLVEILPGTPSASAGLKRMDIVLSINGQAIHQTSDLSAISTRIAAGTRVSLRVWRERKEIEVQLALAGPAVSAAVWATDSVACSRA